MFEGKNGPHFGSGPLLVIQAHQQLILKIFIRSSSDFVMCVHTSALPESPKVRESPRFPAKACLGEKKAELFPLSQNDASYE